MLCALRRKGMESVASGEPETSAKRVGPGGGRFLLLFCRTLTPEECRFWEVS